MTEHDHPACLLLADGAWGSPLHAMRSLAPRGIATYVATAGSGAALLGRSRFCAAAVDLDPSGSVSFCEAVAAWLARVHPGDGPIVVIPLSDRMVSVLDEARHAFPDRFVVSVPSPPSVRTLVDKSLSFRVAEQAGLDVPVWTTVEAESDIERAVATPVPVAVRPSSWATFGETYFKLHVHDNRAEFEADLRRQVASGARLIAQEYLDVPEDAVEFAILWRSADAAVTAICTGRKRRQSGADGGVMVWGEAVPLPDVAEAAVRYLDSSGFTGLGGIEFIRDRGRLRFIEFNPRLEAIHFLAKGAGVDMVPLAFDDLVGAGPPARIPRQRYAAAWVGSAWLGRFLDDPRARRLLLRDRLRFAMSPNRVRAVWSWTDPLPGLSLSFRLVTSRLRRIWSRPAPGGAPR